MLPIFTKESDGVVMPSRVKLDGIKSQPQLNGKFGVTMGYDAHAARYIVAVDDGAFIRLKSANLTAAPTVEVRLPSSWRALHETLKDELRPGTFVLVDRKKNNRVLKDFINAASADGVRVHVHGVDEEEEEEQGDAGVQCGTYWSGKGLNCETAIVLLPDRADRNATYVAMTRACRKLIVVLDPRAMHVAACRAALKGVEEGRVHVASGVRKITQAVDAAEEDVSLTSRPWRQVTRTIADDTTLSLSDLKRVTRAVIDDGGEALEADGSKRDAMVRTALVTLEWKATGKVRRMEDVLHPTRMDAGDHLAAIRAGFVGRAVPGYVSDAALIAPDLREKANRCYPPSSTEDAMTVALATLAWDDFDHVMRRAFPLAAWSATAEAVVARAATLLAGVTDFDTRLNAPDHAEAWSTVRVDATTPTHAWHVVWASSNVELGKACVRARLHPRRVCLLAELETGKVTRVEA